MTNPREQAIDRLGYALHLQNTNCCLKLEDCKKLATIALDALNIRIASAVDGGLDIDFIKGRPKPQVYVENIGVKNDRYN